MMDLLSIAWLDLGILGYRWGRPSKSNFAAVSLLVNPCDALLGYQTVFKKIEVFT
jgi:hypothetical protein